MRSEVGEAGLGFAYEMLDLLPDGVVVADAQGVVTHANAPGRRLLGVDDPTGKHLADVLALQDHDGNDWYASTKPYAGLGIVTGQAEQAWFLADGTELLLTARIVRDSPREPVRQVVVSVRSARARQRLDRERSDLVATVAHELRSPLTGVKGFAATLLTKWDRLSDEQKLLMLETVNADADRLARLIAELLDVARIDTGRLSLHPRPLDLGQALDRILASVRAGTGREIVREVADDLPRVLADPDRFAQVATNLVENAVRHGEGLVQVTVVETPAADPFRGVMMVVDDEGEGISPDIRSRVFTKFWKHGARGGTGLGMYIAHGLVLAHHGEIEIADAPGGGARIVVRLPAEPPDEG